MEKTTLHNGWMFWKDGEEEQAISVRIPHDAMIDERREPSVPSGSASGYYPGGLYHYSFTFNGKGVWKQDTLILEFEGIYMDSTIFLNGEKIGGWYYGYTGFYVDISGKVRDGENILHVVVNNRMQPNSRWYTGSGIYRNVNLYSGNAEYIHPDGIRVTLKQETPAVILLETEATHGADSKIMYNIIYNNRIVAMAEGDSVEVQISNAAMWSAEQPNLYTIQAWIENKNGKIIDTASIRTGFRKLSWDAENGFCVNGKSVKLAGACVHHDHGILGSRADLSAERRRISTLKKLGFNAVRYAHNPTYRGFLDICDELGMYVMEETFDQWRLPQSDYDYSVRFEEEWKKDINALVHKDYSHPSVVMYCIGNEVADTGLPEGADTAAMLSDHFRTLDLTRSITIANNTLLSFMTRQTKQESKPSTVNSKDANDMVTALTAIMESITPQIQEDVLGDTYKQVDIAGYNYMNHTYEGTHELAPDRVILGTETYPSHIGINWPEVLKHDYVIGDFMWTGWDYLGEAGMGLPVYGTDKADFCKPFPALCAGAGAVDLTGYVESQGIYASVVFGVRRAPYIAVRPVDHSGEKYNIGMLKDNGNKLRSIWK